MRDIGDIVHEIVKITLLRFRYQRPKEPMNNKSATVSQSQGRHKHHGLSNHRQFECLFSYHKRRYQDTGVFHSHGEIDARALIFVQLFAWTNCRTNIRVAGGLRRYRSRFHYWNFDRLSYSFKLERWLIYSLPRRSFTRTMVHTCTVSVCRRTDRRTDKVQPTTNIPLPPSQEENGIAIATNVIWC